MEKTCRTCVHRKNYECTCKELKENLFPTIDLDGLSEGIESYVRDVFDDFLVRSKNIDTNDDAYDEMEEFIENECVGENIIDIIKEKIDDFISLEIDLDSDFVCKYWR